VLHQGAVDPEIVHRHGLGVTERHDAATEVVECEAAIPKIFCLQQRGPPTLRSCYR
jgi:hypothetical protein